MVWGVHVYMLLRHLYDLIYNPFLANLSACSSPLMFVWALTL